MAVFHIPSSYECHCGHVSHFFENTEREMETLSKLNGRLSEEDYQRQFGHLQAEREQLREFLMKHYPVPEHIAQYAETLK